MKKGKVFVLGFVCGMIVALSSAALADGLTPSVPSECCKYACLDPFSSLGIVRVCGCH